MKKGVSEKLELNTCSVSGVGGCEVEGVTQDYLAAWRRLKDVVVKSSVQMRAENKIHKFLILHVGLGKTRIAFLDLLEFGYTLKLLENGSQCFVSHFSFFP